VDALLVMDGLVGGNGGWGRFWKLSWGRGIEILVLLKKGEVSEVSNSALRDLHVECLPALTITYCIITAGKFMYSRSGQKGMEVC
jgi:hypothetical protein